MEIVPEFVGLDYHSETTRACVMDGRLDPSAPSCHLRPSLPRFDASVRPTGASKRVQGISSRRRSHRRQIARRRSWLVQFWKQAGCDAPAQRSVHDACF